LALQPHSRCQEPNRRVDRVTINLGFRLPDNRQVVELNRHGRSSLSWAVRRSVCGV